MHPAPAPHRASWLVALLLASTACHREVACADRNAGTTSVAFRACSDGRARVLSCVLDPPPGAPPTGSSTWRCTCAEGGAITHTFTVDEPGPTVDVSTAAGVARVNQRCGWRVAAP